MVIQPLSTRLIKPNFCLHGNSRRTCSTQTEDASSVNDKWSLVSAHHPSSLFFMSFSFIFFSLSLIRQHILCLHGFSFLWNAHLDWCTNLCHFQFLLVNYWTWRDCCWISHAMYPSCYKKSKQYLHKRTYVRFYSMTGLQITVGHRTVAEQNLLMSDQSRTVV